MTAPSDAAAGTYLPIPDADDLVVLLDDQRRPIGTAPRATVHNHATPLHLAFSCYAFDRAGRLLVTRRALGKKTWPGVWTNSCCGHPRPGEEVADAAARRLAEELGMLPRTLDLVLPTFAYRAEMADGTVENEVCPVLRATVDGDPEPDPAEVADWRWVNWSDYVQVARVTPWLISPWSALQVPELAG
ncbi:MAG: isopentenyl-diphosphate Delta-isomerase [Mycobacteriales bacterium]